MKKTLKRPAPLDETIQFSMFFRTKPDSPLMVDPWVTTQARVRLDVPNMDRPDSTYAPYDQPGGHDTYVYKGNPYAKGNAINVGKRLADWQEYQGLVNGMGENRTRNPGKVRRGFGGTIFIQNWGTLQHSGKGLMKNPCDAVAYNGKTFYAGFHSKASVRLTPDQLNAAALTESLSIGDFIKVALVTLRAECDARGLCYPTHLAWDWEDAIGPDGLIGFNNTVTDPNDPKRILSGWQVVQQDPRYKTEIVYDDHVNGRWVGKTLHDAFVEAGSPESVVYDKATGTKPVYWFQDVNREFMKKMTPYFMRIIDRALHTTLYRVAREVFANIQGGNYSSKFPMSAKYENHFPEVQNPFLRLPSDESKFVVSMVPPKRYLRAHYQCPVCYSPNMAPNRFSPENYAPASQVADRNYLANMPSIQPYYAKHSFGDGLNGENTRRTIYRDINVQRVKACLAEGNPIGVIPYIEPPFENAAGGDFGAANVYNPDESDILYILQEHYKLGVRRWHLFNTGFFLQSDDIITDRIQRFQNVLTEFRRWISAPIVDTATPVD